MNPVSKALWYIESHLGEDMTLDDVAAAAGVSRFHIARIFGNALDRPVMRHIRARRLSEAARLLAEGAPDILSVALGAGYGSHEAFTRAFHDQFGITPEQLRSERRLHSIELVEANLMDTRLETDLEPPRFVEGRLMLIAGFGDRFEYGSMDGLPTIWQRSQPAHRAISDEVPGVAYGVCTNSDANGFDYVCGVEVRGFSDLDPEFTRLRIEARRYAVFVHRDHVSTI